MQSYGAAEFGRRSCDENLRHVLGNAFEYTRGCECVPMHDTHPQVRMFVREQNSASVQSLVLAKQLIRTE